MLRVSTQLVASNILQQKHILSFCHILCACQSLSVSLQMCCILQPGSNETYSKSPSTVRSSSSNGAAAAMEQQPYARFELSVTLALHTLGASWRILR